MRSLVATNAELTVEVNMQPLVLT